MVADKGFDIEDILHKKKIKLNIPPYLQSKGQFSVRPSQFNALFPIARPTHFFGKVKKKKILVVFTPIVIN